MQYTVYNEAGVSMLKDVDMNTLVQARYVNTDITRDRVKGLTVGGAVRADMNFCKIERTK